MWKLKKPALADAIGDIPNVIARSNRKLSAQDAPMLEQLYRDYDSGNGHVDDATHDAIPDEKAQIVFAQYPKTRYAYGSEGLKYIRRELMATAQHCPYCGFGELHHLDHVMPESRYGALSVCRLNLVPSCSVCNQYKGHQHIFHHPYYQAFPVVVRFLVATIRIVDDVIVVSFGIDGSAIDNVLATSLRKQLKELHLDDRLRREVNQYLREIPLPALLSDEALRTYLSILLDDLKAQFGLNHWKTAVIDALLALPDLTADHIRRHKAAMVDPEQAV